MSMSRRDIYRFVLGLVARMSVITGAVVASAYAWILTASLIFCFGVHHPELLAFPYTQWADAASLFHVVNWQIKMWIVTAAVPPSAVVLIALKASGALRTASNAATLRREPMGGPWPDARRRSADQAQAFRLLMSVASRRTEMKGEHGVVPEHDLVIGKALDGRDFLCFGGGEHSVLHARSGAGKSVGFSIPNAFAWPGAWSV